MKFELLWAVKYLYVIIFFHWTSSLPVKNDSIDNEITVPTSALTNLIQDGFSTLKSQIQFNGNNIIHLHLISSSQAENEAKKNRTSPKLPSGYTELSRTDEFITAYKLYLTKTTWNQARNTCRSEGGYLAYLDSAEEGSKFQEIMTSKKSGPIWIGIHDLFTEGDWVTVHGEEVSKLDYVNWREHEPNNSGDSGEHCGALGLDAMMNDVSCQTAFAYFCKIRVKF